MAVFVHTTSRGASEPFTNAKATSLAPIASLIALAAAVANSVLSASLKAAANIVRSKIARALIRALSCALPCELVALCGRASLPWLWLDASRAILLQRSWLFR